MDKCTRCGKELNDLKISINFNIKVDRMKDSSIWEYIPNLDNHSNEILCMECFEQFSELMSQLNIKYEK